MEVVSSWLPLHMGEMIFHEAGLLVVFVAEKWRRRLVEYLTIQTEESWIHSVLNNTSKLNALKACLLITRFERRGLPRGTFWLF